MIFQSFRSLIVVGLVEILQVTGVFERTQPLCEFDIEMGVLQTEPF